MTDSDSLLDKIDLHLRQLPPHMKERVTVVLLVRARDEIARLRDTLQQTILDFTMPPYS